MSIQEMKEYLALCLEGQGTIPQRMELLQRYKQNIHERMAELQDSLDFIAWKENFYREVLEGQDGVPQRPYRRGLNAGFTYF